MFQLQVVARDDCHLCEDMLQALDQHPLGGVFSYQVIDVDSSLDLHEKYSSKVPVLLLEGREICHYFLDTQKLKKALRYNQDKI